MVKPYEVPIPPCNENSLLVKVYYSFVSSGTEHATISASGKSLLQKSFTNATEKLNKVKEALNSNGLAGTIALIKGSLDKVLELGYSCSGQVVSVGKNINSFKIGDFVACAGSGIANHAECISVPKHLAVKIFKRSCLKEASLTTIGAIALQGIRRANLKLGETVCVFGLGLIGQLTVQLAKCSGCTVFGIDINEEKLELAKKLGCDGVFNAADANIVKEFEFATHHHGVDATIITAAASSGTIIQQAMEITRRKGKVVLVGDVKIDFDRSPFYQKEIDFLISCSYGPGRYDNSYEKSGVDYPYEYVRWTENRNMELFANLIQKKQIKINPLISNVYPLEKSENAYSKLQEKNNLGILLEYGPFDKTLRDDFYEIPQGERNIINHTNHHSKINIAMVGAGGFAKTKLLPIISKIKNVKINTVVDTNSANAINVSNQYKTNNFNNDYKKTLNNNSINTVVIATPHATHAQQSIDFLRAGKAVFVEKPAATTFEQLNELKTFFEQNPNSFYCVDFNRSFAPFTLAIKKEVTKRTTPLVIQYRMNAGYIPKDHWIQSQTHGGRIIGEACHIFELFCFLTDAKPVDISVHSISPEKNDVLQSDNFNAQITFDDGSCCSLLYTAIGNTSLEKERMEIFFDGKSIVMNDYKELTGYGLPKSFNKKTKSADKGHKNLIEQFFTAVKTKTAVPLPIERIITATELSLIIDKKIREKRNCCGKSKNNK